MRMLILAVMLGVGLAWGQTKANPNADYLHKPIFDPPGNVRFPNGKSGLSAGAFGRWKSTDGNDPVTPPATAKIDCFKGEFCVEAIVYDAIGTGIPIPTITYYRIARWDQNGIVAISSDGICTTSQLIINFADQTVTGIESPKAKTRLDYLDVCKFAKTATYNLVSIVKR